MVPAAIVLSCSAWVASFDESWRQDTYYTELAENSGYAVVHPMATRVPVRLFVRDSSSFFLLEIAEALKATGAHLRSRGSCTDHSGALFWISDTETNGVKT
jgi:hypothetical protein